VGLGGVIKECNMLVAVRKLFRNEESPPTRVVQNILQGLLVGVSSSAPPPFDEVINAKQWVTSLLSASAKPPLSMISDGSFSQLFRCLESELMELVPQTPASAGNTSTSRNVEAQPHGNGRAVL
jgi:hypothetical protein